AIAIGVTQDALEGDGIDWAYLEGQGFKGKRGEVRAVPGAQGGTTYVVGLGPADGVDAGTLRYAAGCLARAAKSATSLAVDLIGHASEGTTPARAAQAVAEGLVLGGYTYTAFKSDPKP